MTDRPPWVANQIADLTLQANRDRAALQRVLALIDEAGDRPLWGDQVRAAIDGREET